MSKASEWADAAANPKPIPAGLSWSRRADDPPVAVVGWARPEGNAVIPTLEFKRPGKLMLTGPEALALAKWITDTFGEQS